MRKGKVSLRDRVIGWMGRVASPTVLLILMILVFAFSTVIASSTNAPMLPKQFAPVEAFQIEWGNGNGQVGLLKVPGRNYGPQSFAVDEEDEEIYILDSANRRILIYDMNGDFLSFIPISQMATDLCLGDKGNVYVLHKAKMKVAEYDPHGSVIATYPLADTKSPVVGIHFSSEKGLFFETADETSYPLVEEGVKVSLEAQIKRRILGLGRNNDYFFLERRNPSRGAIRILDSEGKARKELPVPKKGESIETLTLVGIDDENNIYLPRYCRRDGVKHHSRGV